MDQFSRWGETVAVSEVGKVEINLPQSNMKVCDRVLGALGQKRQCKLQRI